MARPASDLLIGTYEISTGTAEIQADPYRGGAYILLVNGVPSSHIVPGQPGELEFEYMRWIAYALEELATSHRRITHLGGAGCSLARYCAQQWPDSQNTVVELDARLAEYVRQWFDIPRSPRVKIRVGEAREVTEGFYPASRDILIRDVFAGAKTPRALTTVEFYHAVSSSLSPEGLYLANCGSHSDLREAKEELAGMVEVFSDLAVIADPPMFKGRRYGNIILLGSNSALPSESPGLSKKLLSGAVPAHFRPDSWVRSFIGGAQPRRD